MPVGLRNIGNTCYFNCIMQIMYFIPCFGRKILELDLDKFKPVKKTRKKTLESEKEARKRESSKKLLDNLQQLFIEMTLSNRKYANPGDVITSVTDENGKVMHVGDEEDVGEIGSRFMNALHEAFQIIDANDIQSSESEVDDGDTDANGLSQSDEEQK